MNRHLRHKEKTDLVIHWLVTFGFSTPKVLCQVLGLSRSNQSHFFVSLKKRRLLTTMRSAFIQEEIYLLTPIGRQYAAMINERTESYTTTKTKILTPTAIHSLSVQMACISRSPNLTYPWPFEPEQFLSPMAGKKPDVLLTSVNRAIEVELTQKSESRIYLGFHNHIKNFLEKTYHSVEYVFSSEALKQAYKNRFDRPIWPIYARDANGKVRQSHSGSEPEYLNVTESLRQRFTFTLERLYGA